MTTQSRHSPISTAPPLHLRLRLKPESCRGGCVDGAWWPRTDDLPTELPDLLAVLFVRLGRPRRVAYKIGSWARAPRKFLVSGQAVSLDGYNYQHDNTIDILGVHRGRRLTLLVVPPDTDARQAQTIMMTAARADNVDTEKDLLNVS